MVKRILKSPVFIATLVAAIFYFSRISAILPLGEETSLAASWLGLNGQPASLSPLWGEFVRLANLLPCDIAVALGLVSAFFGVVAVLLFSFAVRAFLLRALARSEKKADSRDLAYGSTIWIASLSCSLTFAFIPGISLWATRVSPLTLQLALAISPFALAVAMTSCARPFTSVCLAMLAGFGAALAALEGLFGIFAFPFALILVAVAPVRKSLPIATALFVFLVGALIGTVFSQGNLFSWAHVISSLAAIVRNLLANWLPDGFIGVLTLAVLPVCVLYKLFSLRRIKSPRTLIVICVATMLTAATCFFADIIGRQGDYGKAANELVDHALARVGERQWLISDGVFDDLILLKKPADLTLVTFRREFDLDYGAELSGAVKRRFPDRVDLQFAAELGPRELLREWHDSDPGGMAEKCFAITISEPGYGLISPDCFGWRNSDDVSLNDKIANWHTAWSDFAPLLEDDDEPGYKILRRFFSVQGDTLGSMAAAAKDARLAWDVLTFTNENVDSDNLSVLMNLMGLIDYGDVSFVDRNVVENVRSRFTSRIKLISGLIELRYEIAIGGRVFVDPSLRERILEMQKQMAKNVWETPFGKQLAAALDGIKEIDELEGEKRKAKISEVEGTVLPQLRAQRGADWAKWWTMGEFYFAKGPDGYLQARENFRSFIRSGHDESFHVFDRLLMIDFSLGDITETEHDAMLILRVDIRNQLANAALGSMRLEKKNYASAEHYLKRAINLGNPPPGVRNDYALALSGIGRHIDAEREIRSLISDYPDNWNFIDSLSMILQAAGREDDSLRACREARSKANKQGELKIYNRILNERK